MSAAQKVDTLLSQLTGDPAHLLELQSTNMTEMQRRLCKLVLAELHELRQAAAQGDTPDLGRELRVKAQLDAFFEESLGELAKLLVSGGR